MKRLFGATVVIAQKRLMLTSIIVFVIFYLVSLTSVDADTVGFDFTTIDHPLDVRGNTNLVDI